METGWVGDSVIIRRIGLELGLLLYLPPQHTRLGGQTFGRSQDLSHEAISS